MLIEIDRCMGQFDRVGSAIDFRGSFSARAGGFAAATFAICNGNRIDDSHLCDSHG